MSDKFKRNLLIAVPVIVFLLIFFINLSSYMGLYDDLISIILLASAAVILPAQVGNKKIRFGWLLTLSVVLSVAAAGLFWLYKPTVSTKQAAASLVEAGYTEITLSEGQRTYPLKNGGNWFVTKGYQYTCQTAEGETETVQVHPFSGELTVVE